MLLLFSHKLTAEQEIEAQTRFNVTKFIYLPPDLQQIWSNIPPEVDDLSELTKSFYGQIEYNADNDDLALIQGDFGLTYHIVNFCKGKGIVPVYATTLRDIVEEKIKEQIIVKKIFKHVRFRLY